MSIYIYIYIIECLPIGFWGFWACQVSKRSDIPTCMSMFRRRFWEGFSSRLMSDPCTRYRSSGHSDILQRSPPTNYYVQTAVQNDWRTTSGNAIHCLRPLSWPVQCSPFAAPLDRESRNSACEGSSLAPRPRRPCPQYNIIK